MFCMYLNWEIGIGAELTLPLKFSSGHTLQNNVITRGRCLECLLLLLWPPEGGEEELGLVTTSTKKKKWNE